MDFLILARNILGNIARFLVFLIPLYAIYHTIKALILGYDLYKWRLIGALDFGAVGDGVADDTAAFTLAINSGAKNYSRPYWDILTKRTATDSSSVTRY